MWLMLGVTADGKPIHRASFVANARYARTMTTRPRDISAVTAAISAQLGEGPDVGTMAAAEAAAERFGGLTDEYGEDGEEDEEAELWEDELDYEDLDAEAGEEDAGGGAAALGGAEQGEGEVERVSMLGGEDEDEDEDEDDGEYDEDEDEEDEEEEMEEAEEMELPEVLPSVGPDTELPGRPHKVGVGHGISWKCSRIYVAEWARLRIWSCLRCCQVLGLPQSCQAAHLK